MLLLRATVGVTAILYGGFDLNGGVHSGWGPKAFGLFAILCGGALLIGLFTPVAGSLVALGSAGIALSGILAPTPNLPDSNFFDLQLSSLFIAIMAAVAVLLGPGAYSLDSRLFGRREIIIPPN